MKVEVGCRLWSPGLQGSTAFLLFCLSHEPDHEVLQNLKGSAVIFPLPLLSLQGFQAESERIYSELQPSLAWDVGWNFLWEALRAFWAQAMFL